MTKQPSTYIHCRVTQTIAASLKDAAEDTNVTLSEIMRQAFEEYLDKHGYSVCSDYS